MRYKIQMPDGTYSAGGVYGYTSRVGKTWGSFKAFSSHLSAMCPDYVMKRYRGAKIMFFSEGGQSGSIPFDKYNELCKPLAKNGSVRATPEVVAKHLGLPIYDSITESVHIASSEIDAILIDHITISDLRQHVSERIHEVLKRNFLRE